MSRPRARYDRERIAALGLDVVRRPTGGRAVWHAGELTYAVAAPATALGTLREAYGEIHRVIRNALRTFGVPAELAAARAAIRPDAGACFAAPAGGEVIVGDNKLVGSAQLRENGALLQHGSILLADDQAMVARLTRGDAPRGPIGTTRAAAGTAGRLGGGRRGGDRSGGRSMGAAGRARGRLRERRASGAPACRSIPLIRLDLGRQQPRRSGHGIRSYRPGGRH